MDTRVDLITIDKANIRITLNASLHPVVFSEWLALKDNLVMDTTYGQTYSLQGKFIIGNINRKE